MKPNKKLRAKDYFTPGRVLCKNCGTEIAGYVGKGARRFYEQHANYREIKIETDDPRFTYHVTCVCSACVEEVSSSPDLQQQLLDADLDQMVKAVPALRKPLNDRKAKGVVAATSRAEALT